MRIHGGIKSLSRIEGREAVFGRDALEVLGMGRGAVRHVHVHALVPVHAHGSKGVRVQVSVVENADENANESDVRKR